MKKIVALLSATLLASGLTALAAAPASAAPDPTYPLTVTSVPTVAAGSDVSVGQEVKTSITLTNPTDAPVTLFQPTDSETFLTVQLNGTANNVDADIVETFSNKFGFTDLPVNDEDAVQWNTSDEKTLAAGESALLTVSYTVNSIVDDTKPSNVGLDICLNNATGNDCTASVSWPVVPAVAVTCPAPTNVVASNVTKNSATVSWTAPTDPDEVVTSYNLYSGSDFLGNTDQLSVDFAEIDPGTEYNVDVVSVCGDGIESEKASVTFNTVGLEAADTAITGPASVDPAALKDGIEISFSGYASNEDVVFQFSSMKDGVYVPFGTEHTLNVGPLGAGKVVISVAFEDGASIAGTSFRVTGTGQTSEAVANYDFVTTGDPATNPGETPVDGGVTPVTPETPVAAAPTPEATTPTSLASTGVDGGSTPFIILFGTLAMLLGGGAVAFARQKLV